MAGEAGPLASIPPVGKGLMLPPAPRPKRKREMVVLDEDEWTDKLEAIIQRDYFPDLPKLESQLEWLEAVRSQDPVVIRQAQANIAQRRAGLKTPMGQTPATFATPAFAMGTPGLSSAPAAASASIPGLRSEESGAPAPNMSLDAFMAEHTSEDNASFSEILEGINKRKRERYHWLHGQIQEKTKLLENARPLDGYGTSGQPSGALLEWPYEAKNQLYYDRQGMQLSEKEIADQVQGPPKQIKATNTRLPTTTGEEMAEEHRQVRGEGYQEIATPSFTPGPGESPIMTWGELGATPMRLDEDASGRPADTGPRFKMPERKTRDVAGHRLAEGARLKLQERAALFSPAILRSLHTRTPGAGSKLGLGRTPLRTPHGAAMSPAAHRLASSRRKGSSLDDGQLRASYSGKTPVPPSRVTSASPAPSLAHTPAIYHGQQEATESTEVPESERKIRVEALQAFEQASIRRDALKAHGTITDNLLNF